MRRRSDLAIQVAAPRARSAPVTGAAPVLVAGERILTMSEVTLGRTVTDLTVAGHLSRLYQLCYEWPVADLERIAPKSVEWLGDSLKVVKSWPAAARKLAGTDLYAVQLGEYPDGCEKLQQVGPDVHAIRVRSGKEQYRVVWLAKVDEAVFVLHAFHKKSKQGKANPQDDIETARARLSEARTRIAAARSAGKGKRQ